MHCNQDYYPPRPDYPYIAHTFTGYYLLASTLIASEHNIYTISEPDSYHALESNIALFQCRISAVMYTTPRLPEELLQPRS